MRKVSVACAVVAAWSFGCGGSTVSGDSGDSGAGGSRASGGASQGSGGASQTGGAVSTGGIRSVGAVTSCPPRWADIVENFPDACGAGGVTGTGCQSLEAACGLDTFIQSETGRPGRLYCHYSKETGALVGSGFSGKVLGCISYSPEFPPEGFSRGECGPGGYGAGPCAPMKPPSSSGGANGSGA